jgi:hypothetical protein
MAKKKAEEDKKHPAEDPNAKKKHDDEAAAAKKKADEDAAAAAAAKKRADDEAMAKKNPPPGQKPPPPPPQPGQKTPPPPAADNSAKITSCRGYLGQLAAAVEAYHRDNKQYPPAGAAGLLSALSKAPKGGKAYHEFTKEQGSNGQAVDPWGHALIFRVNAKGKKPYELYSVGPDGKDDGGKDDDVNY